MAAVARRLFSAFVLFAVVMSFRSGHPRQGGGRWRARAIYALFIDLAPGFDGVRVPARYATIVTLGLAALAALGIRAIDDRHRVRASAVAGALILLEAFAVPIPINQNSTQYMCARRTPARER